MHRELHHQHRGAHKLWHVFWSWPWNKTGWRNSHYLKTKWTHPCLMSGSCLPFWRHNRSTHPCFTPLLTRKLFQISLLSWTQACIPSWNDWIWACRVGGQPAFASTIKRDLQSTRSKAFVRLTKARQRGYFWSRNFSCNCVWQIMSAVDLCALNHIDTWGIHLCQVAGSS